VDMSSFEVFRAGWVEEERRVGFGSQMDLVWDLWRDPLRPPDSNNYDLDPSRYDEEVKAEMSPIRREELID